ncbi:MAG: acetoacetate decarboxylase family protein [Deltaproteobacteria bacterium]|nr:acetoacetate decarboxylase family protein [Deltaproteobacteria bacterium]
MPDFGKLTAARLPYSTPITAPFYPPPPWHLEDAQILQISFEIEKEASLAWLPPGLTRAIPPYAQIMVTHYPTSPIGSFSLAVLLNVCRYQVRARAFPVTAIVDTVPALAPLREVWAFPAKLGKIALEKVDGRVEASAATADGKPLIALEIGNVEEIDQGQTRFDPFLNLRLVPSVQEGKPPLVLELLQVDPEYHIKAAWRGKPKVTFSEAVAAEGWGVFTPLNMIAGVYSVCDTDLPFARYTQEFEPAPR